MRVLFCTSKLPGAAIIRAVTWSDWSHVAIIDGEEVIEATWPAVRVAPLVDVIAKHNRFTVVDIPCQDPAAVIAAARSQIGKPYDLTALFGMLVHRDWTQSGALPRPAGVGAILITTDIPVFGFSEAGTGSAAPFGQAPFIQEGNTNAAN